MTLTGTALIRLWLCCGTNEGWPGEVCGGDDNSTSTSRSVSTEVFAELSPSFLSHEIVLQMHEICKSTECAYHTEWLRQVGACNSAPLYQAHFSLVSSRAARKNEFRDSTLTRITFRVKRAALFLSIIKPCPHGLVALFDVALCRVSCVESWITAPTLLPNRILTPPTVNY